METGEYSELNGNENISYQNVWGAAVAKPRQEFRALSGYGEGRKTMNELNILLK